MPWRHAALALAVVVVWGANFVVVRVALDEMPPLLFATLRFIFAFLPAAFFVARPRVSWRWLAAYGLLIGAEFGLLFIAMKDSISPGLASLVLQSQAFFTLGLAVVLQGERVRPLQVMGLLVAAIGIAVIVAHADGAATPLGLGLALIAAAAWAGSNLASKASGATDMLGFVVWASLFSIPPVLVAALLLEGPATIVQSLREAGPVTWGAVAWQSVANTLFGYGVWGWLLSRHPATTIAPISLLVPVVGLATSALLLHEPLQPWKLLAAGLVLAGLTLPLLRAPAFNQRLA